MTIEFVNGWRGSGTNTNTSSDLGSVNLLGWWWVDKRVFGYLMFGGMIANFGFRIRCR